MSVWTKANPIPETLSLRVNGVSVKASPQETVATVLLRLGHRSFGRNPVTGARQAPACLIGVCFGCLCRIDGRPGAQACLERVQDGMTVETEEPEAP